MILSNAMKFTSWPRIKDKRKKSFGLVENQGAETLKGKTGRGIAANNKPPVFGMISSSGQLAMKSPPNVKKQTIKPYVFDNIKQSSLIYADEYIIYYYFRKLGILS